MKVRLDELYQMTSFIYHDANLGRSREATLLHFVEVCGMLTLLDRKKKRDRVDKPINRNAIKRILAKIDGMIYLQNRVGINNDRLVIVRDLQPQQVYDNGQHWVNVAIDAAARFSFDQSSGPQPGTHG